MRNARQGELDLGDSLMWQAQTQLAIIQIENEILEAEIKNEKLVQQLNKLRSRTFPEGAQYCESTTVSRGVSVSETTSNITDLQQGS